MKTLPLDIAAALLGKRQRDKDAEEINRKIFLHQRKRTKHSPVERRLFVLPDDFTGGDLKRAKKLMKS